MADFSYQDWIVVGFAIAGFLISAFALFLVWTQLPHRRDR